MGKKIVIFTSSSDIVKSGIGRVLEALSTIELKGVDITVVTDGSFSHSQSIRLNVYNWCKKLPFYWLIRSFLFHKKLKEVKGEFQKVFFTNAFEAFFSTLFLRQTPPIYVFINDYSYIYAHKRFIKYINFQKVAKSVFRYFGYYLEKNVVSRATKVIVCSEFLKLQLIENYQIQEDRIFLLYPPVDVQFFKEKKIETVAKNEVHILFMKNDWRTGGLDILFKALEKPIPNLALTLHVVGIETGEIQKILTLSKKYHFKHQLKVKSVVSKSEVLSTLRLADIFIMPSRLEAFGIAIAEAIATGTPVIASNQGGIREVLAYGKAGYMVNPDCASELREALKVILKNPDLVSSKVKAGIEHIKKFSQDKFTTRWKMLLND